MVQGTQPLYNVPGEFQVKNVQKSDEHYVRETVPVYLAQIWSRGCQITGKNSTF